jgi:transcription-repair coupling factor (superfamily II helicase)
MRDMAEELLKLWRRKRCQAPFSSDSHWQQEFEDAFEYALTARSATTIADIKNDMECDADGSAACSDVGYGKTEVAMRAAFKAVMDGKQVAFLAPTTVLAFQHEKTLKERFAGFPVRIDMISRFRTPQEQKEVVADLAAGKVDVIGGTHRLLSKDVEFRDLGRSSSTRAAVRRCQRKDRALQCGRRADDERDADRDAEHVARRHRHVIRRRRKTGVDSDQRREVRSQVIARHHNEIARGATGVRRSQSRGVDFLHRQPVQRLGRRPRRRRAWTDG